MSLHTNKKARATLFSALLAMATLATGQSAMAEPAAPPLPDAIPVRTQVIPTTEWLPASLGGDLDAAIPISMKASGGKWIEYNVNSYCLYLHNGGSTVFSTCATANGKAGHRTPTGEFKVYQKSAGPICMHPPGDDPVCGIHYATYWGRGGYAFHEAWWMGGRTHQRISHGCVNMRLGDARTVFNFATNGMRV